MSIIGLIGFVLILGIIVLVHEMGHLIVAKRNGVYCHEFSIGMGPKITTITTDKSGTVYNLRWIPLGGYVQMAGEDTGFEADENVDSSKKFDKQKKWPRFKILLAGALMNFILGLVLLFFVGFLSGVNDLDSSKISVIEGSPVQVAGIETADEIISINNQEINTYNDISSVLSTSDKEVEISYKDSDSNVKNVVVSKDENGLLGVSPYKEKFKLFDSISYSIKTFFGIIGSVFYSLYLLATPQASIADLSGPVGIAVLSNGFISKGIASTFIWTAFLSINIGMVNLLPIPALDGGRILFLIIEFFRKKPINRDLETKINNIVFFLLLALIVFVTFQDIFRFKELTNLFK